MSQATEPNLFMVFDVESVGLHGEGFAVGFAIVDRDGGVRTSERFACMPSRCRGTVSGREWVKENVPGLRLTHDGPHQVRAAFWAAWQEWKSRGAVLVADCAWPVEARFLAQCVDDERRPVRGAWDTADSPRDWEGPYPLHDLASIRLAAGLDPLGTNDRLPSELPAHDPLADARQSARLLIEALQAISRMEPAAS